MHISVKPQTCQGHNLCLSYIPEILDVDHEGFAFVPGSPRVAPEAAALARQAVANCPEQALELIDDDEGVS